MSLIKNNMENLLTLSVPGYGTVGAPDAIPTGGLSSTGGDIIQNVITLLMVVAIIVAFFMLLWSGIEWITSQGDKSKVEKARHRIIFTIIGLIVVFLSFMIINVIGRAFGIDILKFDPGSAANSSPAPEQQENRQNNQNNNDRNSRQRREDSNSRQQNRHENKRDNRNRGRTFTEPLHYSLTREV